MLRHRRLTHPLDDDDDEDDAVVVVVVVVVAMTVLAAAAAAAAVVVCVVCVLDANAPSLVHRVVSVRSRALVLHASTPLSLHQQTTHQLAGGRTREAVAHRCRRRHCCCWWWWW